MSDISALWNARSVAVIGASERPGALGRKPMDYLLRYGYKGRILPVNPRSEQILGVPAYPSVRDVPGPVDLALIMVAADRVLGAVDDCVAAGVPLAVIASSGFAETGEEGARLQAEVVARARAGNMRVIGPNCIGAVGYENRVMATFSPLFGAEEVPFEPGSLAFVSQSGALGFGAASLALERGLRPGWVVSTGNDADVTALEVLRELSQEPSVSGLLGYLEDAPDIGTLRALAGSGKPVALLKSGRTEAGGRAAASHTGALATDDRVLDAALRQLGIVRVDDIDELLDVARVFESERRPAGNRVAVVTTSGGSGILAADAIEAEGLELSTLEPQSKEALAGIVPAFGAIDNPVDITATVLSDPTLFDRSLDVLIADDSVDIIVACFCVMAGPDVEKAVTSLAKAAEKGGKPILVARTGADFLAPDAPRDLREAGLPEYPTPARALRAAAALWEVSRPRTALPEASVGAGTTGPLPGATEPELKRLLADAGVAVPRGRTVTGPDDAVRAVEELGGSAVFKAVVPGLLHKTEAGGVEVGVTADGAALAYARIAALGGDVLAEEVVGDGVELIVGVHSSDLGPVLTAGLGGIFTEILDDVAHRLLPLRPGEGAEMLAELRGAKVLAGTRGRPGVDVAAAADVLHRVAELVQDWPQGFSLDLNPVRVLSQGAVVLDAALTGPAATASAEATVEATAVPAAGGAR
ncbi:acetate--CoA ligase family protein [Actinacidiphila acididurans]|uniref:Acetate--CoA ligase family protein n=1 Tax=Actinacidiphila acididurans TaxID=2784346 RepID=A0ABS2TKW2_9ACTN|nr:acetate--CoA ligase [Actinacidiphila acididurans]MBM9503656.1 acetate--CoA ligase family protein [Actinacidiphila acididurans]